MVGDEVGLVRVVTTASRWSRAIHARLGDLDEYRTPVSPRDVAATKLPSASASVGVPHAGQERSTNVPMEYSRRPRRSAVELGADLGPGREEVVVAEAGAPALQQGMRAK